MTLDEAQRRVIHLARLCASAPNTEEGRTAGAKAWALVAEHDLRVVKPTDVPAATQAPPPHPHATHTPHASHMPTAPKAPFDPRRIGDIAQVVADTAVTGLDAAGKIMSAVNGFKRTLPRRR